MRIGIDARLWNQTGVGRYTRNLVFNLLQIDKNNEYVLFVRSEEKNDIKNQISKFKIKNLKLKIIGINIPWHSLREQIVYPGILKKEKLDLAHFPYFSIPVFYKGNYVITIHDLIIHHFPTGKASTLFYPLYWLKRSLYMKLINKAAADSKFVIAVSMATASEIIDHLGVSGNKIKIIHEGVDPLLKGEKNSRSGIDFPYLLYVGNAYPHKNLRSLLDLMKRRDEILPGIKLVVVGPKNYFYESFLAEAKSLGLEDSIILKEDVSDGELFDLYKGAMILINPSFMEGFGLPVLEALRVGTPVVCSDIPSFREIAKDSAIFFNPYSSADIFKKVKLVMGMPGKEKEVLIDRGRKIANSFSWKKTASETLLTYQEVLNR